MRRDDARSSVGCPPTRRGRRRSCAPDGSASRASSRGCSPGRPRRYGGTRSARSSGRRRPRDRRATTNLTPSATTSRRSGRERGRRRAPAEGSARARRPSPSRRRPTPRPSPPAARAAVAAPSTARPPPPAADAPPAPRPDPAGRGMRPRRLQPDLSPATRFERAIARFNACEAGRTVAGLTRTLGAPSVSVGDSAGAEDEVRVTVAWELTWYQWGVDLGDELRPVYELEQGLRGRRDRRRRAPVERLRARRSDRDGRPAPPRGGGRPTGPPLDGQADGERRRRRARQPGAGGDRRGGPQRRRRRGRAGGGDDRQDDQQRRRVSGAAARDSSWPPPTGPTRSS